jgi:hypothetical protein
LDGYQHHQRADWPELSHGSVDRQPNDRLGRSRGWQLFQHRREILRAAWVAYTDANCNCNCNSHCNSHADSDPYPNAYAYPMHGAMYPDAQTSPYPRSAPIRTS